MNSLTKEQKEELIKNVLRSQSYVQSKKSSSLYVGGHPLQDSCYNISSLIYHIVKKEYGIADEDNKVYHCLIQFGEGINKHTYSHFINIVGGKYIDATIEQFNDSSSGFDFSPYDDNEKYYTNLEEETPMEEMVLGEEIDAYELFRDIPLLFKPKPVIKQGFISKLMNKIFSRN
ncbi:hypothetical protein NXZ75_10955 [Lysinibacillus sphaericus]|uniref:hypothetical protein n=1 Tax=Lysinibacillus sphaericus TaxID=1421 RepID=UPI00216253A4|nr:hypothetical protein [Lysinibacillus sphaericus]MCS1382711.1 hypothetical protein [Lysinibacillus sphaericus]